MAKKTTPTITKAEAVRQALAAGKDSPSDGVAFIQQTFGIAMTPQVFSTNKSVINRRGGGGRNGSSKMGETIAVKDFIALKELVRQHGAAGVKQLVDIVR